MLRAILRATTHLNSTLRLPMGAGILLVGVPAYGVLAVVSEIEGSKDYLSYSNLMAGLWLCVAPDFLRIGWTGFNQFLTDIKPAFRSAAEHTAYVERLQRDIFSANYLLFSVPLAMGGLLSLWYSGAVQTSLMSAVYSVFYAVLLFIAGLGFWSIVVMLRTLAGLSVHEISVDVFHWDGFGGFECCGDFALRCVTLFFSGSLLFPKALELINVTGSESLALGTIILVLGTFCGVGLMGFFASQLIVHNLVRREKEQIMTQLKGVLDAAMEDVKRHGIDAEVLHFDRYSSLRRFHDFFYAKAMQVRSWPFDYKVLLQLLSSALIPVLMAILEIYRKVAM